MSDRLIGILHQLDPENDAQWTSQNLPRLEAVEELMGQAVTRKELTEAAPDFNRESHAASMTKPEIAPEQLEHYAASVDDVPDDGLDPDRNPIAPPAGAEPLAAPRDGAHDPDSLEGMQAAVVRINREVGERRDMIAAAQREISDRQVALNVLAERIERIQRKGAAVSPHMEYIASQNRLRQERVERARAAAVASMGAEPAQAPVDRVRRRSTGFGNKAPQVRENMAAAARDKAQGGN